MSTKARKSQRNTRRSPPLAFSFSLHPSDPSTKRLGSLCGVLCLPPTHRPHSAITRGIYPRIFIVDSGRAFELLPPTPRSYRAHASSPRHNFNRHASACAHDCLRDRPVRPRPQVRHLPPVSPQGGRVRRGRRWICRRGPGRPRRRYRYVPCRRRRSLETGGPPFNEETRIRLISQCNS